VVQVNGAKDLFTTTIDGCRANSVTFRAQGHASAEVGSLHAGERVQVRYNESHLEAQNGHAAGNATRAFCGSSAGMASAAGGGFSTSAQQGIAPASRFLASISASLEVPTASATSVQPIG
jgi:hypothetical protein